MNTNSMNQTMEEMARAMVNWCNTYSIVDSVYGIRRLTPEQKAHLENAYREMGCVLNNDEAKKYDNVVDISHVWRKR